ncbi:MAG TPA: hypothetical protein PK228_12800, partial [Saprospiraceae bacterium]|nr:hypothetical protein [Saprospiraceae bacterium]
MSSLAQYTFLPWFRRGLGNQLNQPDPLGPANATGRASLSAALTLNANANTAESLPSKTVSLFGPGDVTGINPTVITKVSPNNNDMDFESNYLAFIEFYDEELPWRFSPASPNLDRLRPWL